MFDEVFYENKKTHRKELIIIVVAYLIVMLLVPYLILHYKIISISANSDSWIVEGQIELAFFIMFLAEFSFAFLVGLITHKGVVYKTLIICSFLVKLVLYTLFSVFAFWFTTSKFNTEIEFLFVRLIVAFYAFKGIFFASILCCIPTLFGVEMGKLYKNKKNEYLINRRIEENEY